VIWDFSAAMLSVDGMISVVLSLPPTTPLGTVLHLSATITPNGTDEDITNNAHAIEQIVVASYDPNDKLVVPSVLTPDQVVAGTPVRYTIRFQNTGTAPAQFVRVRDTLDQRLNAATFRFITSSHPCAWFIENDVLSFVFDNIYLMDSLSDGPGSHGFVTFEITPASTLSIGDIVENIAGIYFDYNEPVITAPAVFSVEEPMAIAEDAEPAILVFPNPAADVVHVVSPNNVNGTSLTINDITGRTVRTVIARNGRTSIDVRDLPAGAYVLRLLDGTNARFTKQ
ncbi:MAG TPA: T9SS type A sorting domain-containing protein, partial [Flavobacteriales bacterium]|nr:T9SS type A sorting domain-containing protein [Flavobacteriales bacterium]